MRVLPSTPASASVLLAVKVLPLATARLPLSDSVPGVVVTSILSTSSGLLTDRQANKKGVGGEVLAYVW